MWLIVQLVFQHKVQYSSAQDSKVQNSGYNSNLYESKTVVDFISYESRNQSIFFSKRTSNNI